MWEELTLSCAKQLCLLLAWETWYMDVSPTASSTERHGMLHTTNTRSMVCFWKCPGGQLEGGARSLQGKILLSLTQSVRNTVHSSCICPECCKCCWVWTVDCSRAERSTEQQDQKLRSRTWYAPCWLQRQQHNLPERNKTRWYVCMSSEVTSIIKQVWTSALLHALCSLMGKQSNLVWSEKTGQ